MHDEYRAIEDRKPKLGCCSKIEKFFVWIVNFVLFVVGLAQIAAGVWAYKSNASDWTGTNVPKACIGMGVVIMFISFLGCCGAWKENRPMLWVYALLLFVLILGQVGALSVAAVSKDYVQRFMEGVWDNMDDVTQTRVEDTYKCCSFQGSDADAEFATPSDKADYTDCSTKHEADKGHDGWADPIESCFDRAHEDVEKHLNTVLIAVAIVAGVQIVILFMTMCLVAGISAKTAVKKDHKKGNRADQEYYPNI